MVKDLTSGKPLKLILQVTIPLIFGNLFQQLYSMADTIIVGQFLGKDALASVGATGCLNFLIIGFVQGVCSGFSIPIAQSFGAGDHERLRRCVASAVWLGAGLTLVLTTATVLWCREILVLLNTPENILDGAYQYLVVIFAGIGATFLYNVLAGFLRALGDSKSPLIFLVISSVLNVGLDLCFIIALDSGVAGAAWATVISQGISGLLCFAYILKKFPILRVRRGEWRPVPDHIKRMLSTGVPMGLQFSITAIGSIVLQSAVNGLGSDAVAAVTASSKVSMLLSSPLEALGITCATYSGQNLGAGRIDRVRKGVSCSLVLSTGWSVVICLVAAFFGSTAAQLFLDSGETAILARVDQYLTFCGLTYFLLGSLLVFRNTIQGLGYGVPAMAAGLFEMIARAAVGIGLVGRFGFDAVCLANPAAWVAANILLIPVYTIVIRHLQRSYPNFNGKTCQK